MNKNSMFFAFFLKQFAMLLCAFFLQNTVSAEAAWTDGQAATLVLGQSSFTSGTVATTQSGMQGPTDVCVDKNTGKVFVMDFGNNRILRFTSSAAMTNGSSAEAVFGQSNYTASSSGQSQTKMTNPMACAMTDAGDLWVTDSNNGRILLFSNASNKPEFNAQADKVLGQADWVSYSSATTQATLNSFARGVAVSADGETVWASCTSQNRVLRWDNVSAKSNGANADAVLGQTDFSSSTSGSTASTLTSPTGLALDSSNNLYVSDFSNNRVLRFANATSFSSGASASGVLGASSTSGAGTGDVTSSTFSQAYAITIASDNKLYVNVFGQNRVLIFNSPASKANGAAADNVLGQASFTASSADTTASTLRAPLGLGYNPLTGYFYIGDYSNNRVLGYYNVDIIQRTLTVSPSTSGGAVSADSGAISACTSTSGTCSGGYGNGTTITLTASPDVGYTTSWISGCSSTSGNTCTVSSISANTSVVVAFSSPNGASVSAGSFSGYFSYGLALLGAGGIAFRLRRKRAQ